MTDPLADELAELDRLPAYLTREEAWTLLRVSDRGLDRMLERGELARRRIGGRTLIPRASIRAWIVAEAAGQADQSESLGTPSTVGSEGPIPLRRSR